MSGHRISYAAEGGVARLALANPSGRNAIDRHFVAEFARCAGLCAADGDVKIVVISANGDYFSVGGDLAEFLAHEDDIEAHVSGLAQTFHAGIEQLHRMDVPIVLVLKGMAAGGGFSLVCGADYVIAAQSARLTSAYTRTGLTPDGGATYFLERIVGYRRAFEILALNAVMTADQACALGIVNKVVADDELDEAAEAVVRTMQATPSDALLKLKCLMRKSADAELNAQLAREAESIGRQGAHPQTVKSLRKFFASDRLT